MKFLDGKTEDRILAIYGLRRTGKTTMLRQAIGALGPARFSQTAYVKVREVDTTEKLGWDLDRLYRRGFRYVFVADSASSGCALYEVKHSLSRTPEQARHLRDEEMLAAAKSRFGRITERTVLYRGEDFDEADGVHYRNAENYLASLV